MRGSAAFGSSICEDVSYFHPCCSAAVASQSKGSSIKVYTNPQQSDRQEFPGKLVPMTEAKNCTPLILRERYVRGKPLRRIGIKKHAPYSSNPPTKFVTRLAMREANLASGKSASATRLNSDSARA